MHYLDTSAVVSLLRPERSTAAVQRWVARHGLDGLRVSDWVSVEVASALSLLQRAGDLDDADRGRADETYALLLASTLDVLPVRRSAYAQAAEWVARRELSLRAGDALHLAVAADEGVELVTRDVEQARAARALGIATSVIGR
jgi:predicted nucleic acid-binding protein